VDKIVEKLNIFITLLAGIIIGIISIFQAVSLEEILLRFIVVVSVSFICATILKRYIDKHVIIPKEDEEDIEDEMIDADFAEDEVELEIPIYGDNDMIDNKEPDTSDIQSEYDDFDDFNDDYDNDYNNDYDYDYDEQSQV